MDFKGKIDFNSRPLFAGNDLALVNEVNAKIGNVVEDLTPQLGGDLDLQTNLIVGESGTEGVYIDSSGKVGIGTISPAYRLQIERPGDNVALYINAEADKQATLYIGDTTQAIYSSPNVNNLKFFVNGGDKAIIDENGRVGIGTTSPTAKLEIADSSWVDVLKLTRTSVGSARIRIANLGSGNVGFNWYLPTATSKMHIDGGLSVGNGYDNYLPPSNGVLIEGNLGIGTTDPKTKTHIMKSAVGGSSYDTTYDVLTIEQNTHTGINILARNNSISFIVFSDGDTRGRGAISYDHSADYLKIATGAVERVRIDSSGNVGIGTTAPTTCLDIEGTNDVLWGKAVEIFIPNLSSGNKNLIHFGKQETADNAAWMAYKYDTTPANTYIGWGHNGKSEQMVLMNNGNVGIGTTSPTAKIDINSSTMRLRVARTITNSTDSGNTGDICWDTDYIYVAVGTNTWKRAALSTW